jgi:putative inorganic carbon (HCO3(-)) transporter
MCKIESISKYYKTSFIGKLLNGLDVTEESTLFKSAKESFILQKLNQFFVFSQNIFSNLSETSIFVKNLDTIILFFITLLMISIIVAPTGIIGLLAFLSFALSFIKLCIKRGEKFSINSLDTAIFLYLAIAGLSVAFSYMPVAAAKGFAKMLVYFGAYLTFYSVIKNNPKKSLYLLGTLAAIASIEALYCIYQQIHGVDALAGWQDLSKANPEQLMNRVYGTLKPYNPNLLAGYLIASFSSAAGMFFYFLTKRTTKLAILSGIGTFSILLAIVFTGSRGAYIAMTGMLMLVVAISGHIIWHDFGHKKWLKNLWLGVIASGIIAVILAIIASPALQHRISSIFAARGDSSNSFRMNVWIATLKMFLDNWFIGIGTGNTVFRLTYGFYMVTGFDALGAYCVPLEIAAESGVFALLSFAWLIFMIVIKGVKTIISDTSLEQKIIISACMIGITGMMLHGLVDTIFYRPQINIIFWMLVAVFAANMPDNAK